jgi:hypothetical protein
MLAILDLYRKQMQAGIGKGIGGTFPVMRTAGSSNATISIFFLPINPVLTRNLTNCPLELTFAISLQTITACAGVGRNQAAFNEPN